MVAFNKINQFTEDLGRGVHNLETGALTVALSNVAPVATNSVLANITQIAAGNGYTTGGTAAATATYAQAAGVGKLIISDVVFTATPATMATFRYVVLYNDTPTSPVDPLIGWYDNGATVSLANTETFTVDFDATNGVLTVT